MRCIIWAAVSSKSQASEEKDSIPSQISAARQFIQHNEGWHEIAEPLTIPGHSRSYIFLADAAADMPVYTELMSLAREDKIDLLICRGRDRLGRKDALIAQVEEYLASYDVQVYSLAMPTRVQDPKEFAESKDRASVWMRSVERAKAQDEVIELQARFRMGTMRRVKDGLHPNNNLPYGYRLGEDGVGLPYEPEAAIVLHIFAWFLEGKTYEAIRDLARVHASEGYPRNTTAIKHMLGNPYYAGHVSWHRWDHRIRDWRHRSEWLVAPGRHEGIISEDTWQAVQREMAARMEQGKRLPYTSYPLSGFVFCGYCDGTMTVSGGGSTRGLYKYYICRHANCPRPKGRNPIRVDALEPMVLDWLIERVTRPELLQDDLVTLAENLDNDVEEDVAALRQAERRSLQALEQWRQDYEDELIDRSEYYTHRERLEGQLELIQSELEAKERRIARLDPDRLTEHLERIIGESIEDFKTAWYDRSNVREVKALLRQIGLRITIAKDEQKTELAL